jgi:hypothetical protein
LRSANSAPASVTTVLGAAVACMIAFGHLGPAPAAVLASMATAIGTLGVAIRGGLDGKPVSMQVITGAATIIFSDLALLGVHMTADARGALVAATGVIAGMTFHLLHVTVVSTRAPVSPPPEEAVPLRPADPGLHGRFTRHPTTGGAA